MASRRWSERSRTEKFQIAFAVVGLAAATLAVPDADLLVRIVLIFLGTLAGAGVGYVAASVTDRSS